MRKSFGKLSYESMPAASTHYVSICPLPVAPLHKIGED